MLFAYKLWTIHLTKEKAMTQTTEPTKKATEQTNTLFNTPLVEVIKEFNAPLEKVWRAWSDTEMIKQWWGPENYTAPSANSDFREEGKYLFAMKSPEGKVTWSTGTYNEIFPMELIVCTDQFADKNGNVITPEAAGMSADWKGRDSLIFSVKFVKVDDIHTKIFLVHEGIPESMHDDCVSGWDTSLDKMKKVVEAH
jgi:uncharacterized protein YndB with AHSA1/START domain